MNAVYAVLSLVGALVAALWIVRALRASRAAVPVVLVKGIDGRTREVPLDELERRLDRRS